MKLNAGQIDAFIRKPNPAMCAILVYGPDNGLARERAALLVRGAVADPADPFLVADLTGENIAADPARLMDEAAAIPLTGGRRIVRVRDASPSAPGAGEAVGVVPATRDADEHAAEVEDHRVDLWLRHLARSRLTRRVDHGPAAAVGVIASVGHNGTPTQDASNRPR